MNEHRMPNGHLVSGRIESPTQAMKGLEPGAILSGLYDGSWTLVDMLFEILKVTGPSDITLSTWTHKGAKIDHLMMMVQNENVRSLKLLVNENFSDNNVKVVSTLERKYGAGCVMEWRAHSKFATVINGAFDVLYLPSANLDTTLRMEAFTLIGGLNAAREYLAFAKDVLYKPSQKRRFSRDGLTKEIKE